MLGNFPHSLVSWDLVQEGAAGRTFAPGATYPRAATVQWTGLECVRQQSVEKVIDRELLRSLLL